MKKVVWCILLLIIFVPNVSAQKGCCSWHGGVSGSCSGGYIVCNDGTRSPSCTCNDNSTTKTYTPSYVYGCTDRNAINYNSSANKDDGSCINKVYGCTNQSAINYNQSANTSDGTCQFEEEITQTKEIDYDTKYVDNDEMTKDEEKVTTKGVKGKKQIVYKIITDESGKEISKEKVSQTVLKEPTTEIIQRGTKDNITPTFLIIWIIGAIIAFIKANKKSAIK